jgi:hypothetical protein
MCGQGSPKIHVDDAGKLYAVWTDFRNFTNNDVYYSESIDDGITWSANINVTPIEENQGGGGLDVDDNGNVYIVYNHQRSVYFTTSLIIPQDTIPPTLTISQPYDGQNFTTSDITVKGTASDESGIWKVTVNGDVASGTTSWSKNITLNKGTNTITVIASDDSPNHNSKTKTLTVTHGVLGDVSLDGNITSYDAVLILQHTVEILILNDEQKKIADVDCNERITAWDASLILQYVVGRITEFPCQTGKPPAIADLSNYNIAISLPSLSVKPNEPILLPIQIKQDMSVVSACELTLNYETGILTPTRVMATDATKEYKLEYQIKDGKINIALAGAEAIAKSVALAQIEFAPQSQAMISRISLEKVRLNGRLVPVAAQGTIEILPEKSALLQNFPNPFNPETWLPYQLTREAEVVIQIYNIKGELVRTLSIGHKPAGSYLSKEKAVLWNGKNQNGEAVANGLYFYTLKAGNFQATRKMILVK